MNTNYIKSILFSGILCLLLVEVRAQNPIANGAFGYYQDAIRFAQTRPGATARVQGIGGAATAIGGDISSSSINPAGLGFMQRSEISIAPSVSSIGTTSTFQLGSNNFPTEDNRLNFNIAQFGGAFVIPSRKESKFKGGTFAITYARQNSFHQDVSYVGTNSQNSIVDFFLEEAQGIPWNDIDPFNEPIDLLSAAFRTYLIDVDPDGVDGEYYSIIPVAPTEQRETIAYRGSQSQWNISYGGNYHDKLYFGASIGVQSFRYSEEKTYQEQVVGAPNDPFAPEPFRDLAIRENLDITGTGVNFTAGAIYRPIYALRIGASITTPTYFAVRDNYSGSVVARFNNFDYGDDQNGNPVILNEERGFTPIIESTYNMTTPLRASLGTAVFVGKYGFISADVDFINYSSTNLLNAPPEFDFNADNQTIENLYASAMNYRLGAEARFNTFYVRGGIGLYGNVVNEDFRESSNQFIDQNAFQSVFSGGIGIHKEKFYLDLAFNYQTNNSTYTPYNLIDNTNPNIGIETRLTNVMTTIGFHF